MAMSGQQRLMLLVCCSLSAAPGFAERMGHQDFAGPPELTADPCQVADPDDPHQILGPNPSHASCLSALYPPLVPASSSADITTSTAPGERAEGESSLSVSMAGTLWLYVVGIGMLVLAGFNSRKRHRHLPAPQFPSALDQAIERQMHSEGSRRNED